MLTTWYSQIHVTTAKIIQGNTHHSRRALILPIDFGAIQAIYLLIYLLTIINLPKWQCAFYSFSVFADLLTTWHVYKLLYFTFYVLFYYNFLHYVCSHDLRWRNMVLTELHFTSQNTHKESTCADRNLVVWSGTSWRILVIKANLSSVLTSHFVLTNSAVGKRADCTVDNLRQITQASSILYADFKKLQMNLQ